MGLWIFLGIVLFLILLLLLPIRLFIQYTEDVRVYLSVFGIRIRLYPRKKKIRPRDYTLRKLRKKRKKAALKAAKKKPKVASAHAAAPKKKTVRDHIRTVKFICHFLSRIQLRLRNTFSVSIRKLYIRIGTEEAASTALLYGVVSGLVSNLLEIVDGFLKTSHKYKKIAVIPDYCSTQTSVEIKIVLTSNLRRLLTMALSALFAFISEKNEQNEQIQKTEEKDNGKRKSV